MAGAFSGHLLQSYNAMNSSMTTSGAISFNPMVHGTPMHSFFSSPAPFVPSALDMSEETAMKTAALQKKLNQRLGPEFISQRPGPGGGPKLTYAEGWKMINLANDVFGFNGWSSNVVSVTTDFVDYNEASGRYNVGVTALVKVSLRDGVYHEDIGYGMLENSRSKGQALDKCKKEAITDGLKRALRNFGNLMGNCLYDKAYTQEVVKMKLPPTKFNQSELHRRPEFAEESKPLINSTACTPKPAAPAPNTSNTSASNQQSGSSTGRGRQPQPQPISRATATSRSSVNLINGTISPPAANTSIPSTSGTPNQNVRGPQPKQQTRHVSFTEPSVQPSRLADVGPPQVLQAAAPKIESEDIFDFVDDDDAFLAALDLAEGDLGRPIETETDLGQPLHHDDSLGILQNEVTAAPGAITTAAGSGPKDNIPQADKATRLQRLQQQVLNASSPKDTPSAIFASPPIQQSTPKEHTSNASSSKHVTPNDHNTFPLRPPQVTRSSNQPLHPQRHHQASARPSPIQRQDNNSNLAPSGPNESRAEHILVPSVGGFHFPPGMNPPQPNNRVQPNQPNGKVGVKRSAEAMSISGEGDAGSRSINGSRGARPGMGLQQAMAPRREPFTPLEVGEGGGVKRVKR